MRPLAILAFFVVWELRTEAPLVPFGIFRIRTLTGANVVGFLLGASIYANFFVLTLYVQQVLGWSALKTGVTFLATAGTTVIWAGVAQALVTRVGPRWVMTVGMTVLALTMLGYTRLPVDGSYWPDLLPLYLIFALGLAFGFIPVTIAGFIGVPPQQAGLASGLLNTSQQIGGAFGVADRVDDLRLEGEVRSLHAAGVHDRLPLGVRRARRVRRRRRGPGVHLLPRRPRAEEELEEAPVAASYS